MAAFVILSLAAQLNANMNTRALKILASTKWLPLLLLSTLPALAQTQFSHTVSNATATSTAGCTGSGAQTAALTAHTAAIPLDQIGNVAGKQYSGDSLAVASTSGGATLRCVFQRLNAGVTTEGLWVVSTKDGAKGEPFRVIASALGRENEEPLPRSGKVEVAGQTARFIRTGLAEEYAVSIDGLQQDFVIERRSPDKGPLRLALEVDGAKAEAMAGGARLVLDDGGRQMVYNRVKAVDARGKELAARLEVLSPRRLAVVLDDAGAVYPVRIDPTFSDANWISMGIFPGVDQVVKAAVVDSSGNLYVGGSFTTAGGVSANYVAQWNGSSWSALGSGMSDEVLALAVSGSTLYAGGDFTTAGGKGSAYAAEALLYTPPLILTTDGSFGVKSNQFGFNINWTGNTSVVVEAATNLANPVWLPVSTNVLTGGMSYFSDPQWMNSPGRFYRLSSQ
jgi:hypothetical protein